jgi:class 3 adenylate cyclase
LVEEKIPTRFILVSLTYCSNQSSCPKTRQLAAIMFTDIVGYTAMMEAMSKKQ